MALNSSTFTPPPPPDSSLSTFLLPSPLHPPLSYTNVSHNLTDVEVGVLCFRQKTLAFLLSSGWV